MSTYDPAVHGTYGQWLRDKGIQVRGDRSVPRTREPVDENGRRRRIVTERTDSGAVTVTTNRTDERGRDHQDVTVQVPTLRGMAGVRS